MDIKSILQLGFFTRVNVQGYIKSISPTKNMSIQIQDSSNSSIYIFFSKPSHPLIISSKLKCKNLLYEPNSSILIADSKSEILYIESEETKQKISEAKLERLKVYNNRLTIEEFNEKVKSKDFSEKIKIIGLITNITIEEKYPFWYPGCTVEKCNKKVESYNSGYYYCRKCDIASNSFTYKFGVEITISDCTGKLKLKLFDCTARKLYGISAEELVLTSYNDKAQAEFILASVIGKFMKFFISPKQIKKNIPVDDIKEIDERKIVKDLLTEVSNIFR